MCRIKPKEREKYKELIKVAEPLLLKINEIIDEDIKDIEEAEEDFSKPSWALETAYKKGLKKGLTQLKKYVIIES